MVSGRGLSEWPVAALPHWVDPQDRQAGGNKDIHADRCKVPVSARRQGRRDRSFDEGHRWVRDTEAEPE